MHCPHPEVFQRIMATATVNEDLTKSLSKLSLSPQLGLRWIEAAEERVTEALGAEWTDDKIHKAYMWQSPAGKKKAGDKAEAFTIKQLTNKKFVKLMKEPLYVISGREYCFIKSGRNLIR